MMAKGLKFLNKEIEGFYYLCSENNGDDQLGSNCTADLRQLICIFVFAYAKGMFSHDKAHMGLVKVLKSLLF